MRRAYLDNNAITAADQRVIEAMALEMSYGASNPSSLHREGQHARVRLAHYRRIIQNYFQLSSIRHVLFSSSATEALTLLIRGLYKGLGAPQGTIISSNAEHPSVSKALAGLVEDYPLLDIEALAVGLVGSVSLASLRQACQKRRPLFVVLSAVNHETGVKTDLTAIGSYLADLKIPLLVDGVAWVGKELIAALPLGVSAMVFSGSKIHGPSGTGVLLFKESLLLKPLLMGGNQEYGLRAGTENLPAIAGLACAVALLKEELPAAQDRMKRLIDRLLEGLHSLDIDYAINGSGERIANTCNLFLPDFVGKEILVLLDLKGVAVSRGAACASGVAHGSELLLKMGFSHERAGGSIRVSLSRQNNEEDIDHFLMALADIKRGSLCG